MKQKQFSTHEAREEERQYIKFVNPLKPGKTFNNDPACFARYCEMQLKAFKEFDNGSFDWFYKDIQDAIDIARKVKA